MPTKHSECCHLREELNPLHTNRTQLDLREGEGEGRRGGGAGHSSLSSLSSHPTSSERFSPAIPWKHTWCMVTRSLGKCRGL